MFEMNDRLQKFAREEILEDLEQCTSAQVQIFRAMYAPRLDQLTIVDVVNNIPAENLSWAMEQTRKTVLKNRGER
jgi:hypothetical protein